MKAIAVAIKEGADAQREGHEKQVARLEVKRTPKICRIAVMVH